MNFNEMLSLCEIPSSDFCKLLGHVPKVLAGSKNSVAEWSRMSLPKLNKNGQLQKD